MNGMIGLLGTFSWPSHCVMGWPWAVVVLMSRSFSLLVRGLSWLADAGGPQAIRAFHGDDT